MEFDMNMLLVELWRWRKNNNEDPDFKKKYIGLMGDLNKCKKYCTMQESVDLCNIVAVSSRDGKEFVKFPSLSELHNHLFGFIPSNLHNSLNDVIICLRCFHMINQGNVDICEVNNDIKKLMYELTPVK